MDARVPNSIFNSIQETAHLCRGFTCAASKLLAGDQRRQPIHYSHICSRLRSASHFLRKMMIARQFLMRKGCFFLDFEGHFGRFPHFLVLAPEVGFQKHRLHDFWPWLQKLALSFSFPKENDDCASVPHEKRLVFFWILRVILEEFLTFWLWLQKSIPRSIDFMISGPGSRNLR